MSKIKKMSTKNKQSYKPYVMIAAVLVLLFAGYKLMTPQSPNEYDIQANNKQSEGILEGINLKLTKADITDQVSFYPYKEADYYMEVIAVKAKDGSIRTALNTCQVCFDSGKGYYEQVGDTLVCQNCGNVFGIEDIELVKGGCNPVPIMKENKTEDGEFITISGEFMAQNQNYFERWKR